MTTPQQDPSREAFEATQNKFHLARHALQGDYCYSDVQKAWEAWQAALAWAASKVKPRRATTEQINEWAQRHDLRGSESELRAVFEDAQTLCFYPHPAEPAAQVPGWFLADEHLNEPQQESIAKLVARAKHAHMTDIDMRINGQNEYWQADWIKHMERASPSVQTKGGSDRPAGFVKPDNDRQVFFYEQDFYVLSNFSAFNLEWKGRVFPTSEHAYHWEKFAGQGRDGDGIAERIAVAPSAHEAFKMAEMHKAYRRPDWDDVKVNIMRHILRNKAFQHEYVRRKLLATGDRTLVEDSWRDDYWGWGPNRTGQNVLGKLWMEVRHELRAIDAAMAAQGENK